MIVKKSSFHFLIASLLLIVFNNCSLPQLTKEAPEINEVKPNTRFRINLPEDHTTGYLWQLSAGFDQAVLEEMNAVWHGNKKGIDFNFRSLSAGQTCVTFVLRKHTDTANVKSFIVKITGK